MGPQLVATLIGISLLLVIPAGRSATVTWTGPATGTWSTASSWSGGVLPSLTDSVLISGASLTTDVKVEVQQLNLTDMASLYTDVAFGFEISGSLTVSSGSELFIRALDVTFGTVILDDAKIYGAEMLTFVDFTCSGGGAVLNATLQTGLHGDAVLLLDGCDLSGTLGLWSNYGPISNGNASVVRGTNHIGKMVAYGRIDLEPNSVLQSTVAEGMWSSNLGRVTGAPNAVVEAPWIFLYATLLTLPAVKSAASVYFNASSEIDARMFDLLFTTNSDTEYLTAVFGGVPASLSEQFRIAVNFEDGFSPDNETEFVIARFHPGSNVTITPSFTDGYNKSFTIGADFISVRIIGVSPKHHKKHFPIWAIVVIAVVPSVLVVIGVGVFFYCRRRPDYQSIR